MQYEKKCDKCNGTGAIACIAGLLAADTPKINCDICKGNGWLINEEGKQLLNFLKRYTTNDLITVDSFDGL